jgi:exosortase/archaeosortase family protein
MKMKHYPMILLIALGIYYSGQSFPLGIYRLFAVTSGEMVAFITGWLPMMDAGGELIIAAPEKPIHITPQCNGFGFFSLMLAFVWVRVLFRKQNLLTAIAQFWLILFSVYLIAVLSNVMRMMLAYHVHVMSQVLFPAKYQAGIHMGIGVLTFLFIFMGISICLDVWDRFVAGRRAEAVTPQLG